MQCHQLIQCIQGARRPIRAADGTNDGDAKQFIIYLGALKSLFPPSLYSTPNKIKYCFSESMFGNVGASYGPQNTVNVL
jgi:hypothetical protein